MVLIPEDCLLSNEDEKNVVKNEIKRRNQRTSVKNCFKIIWKSLTSSIHRSIPAIGSDSITRYAWCSWEVLVDQEVRVVPRSMDPVLLSPQLSIHQVLPCRPSSWEDSMAEERSSFKLVVMRKYFSKRFSKNTTNACVCDRSHLQEMFLN